MTPSDSGIPFESPPLRWVERRHEARCVVTGCDVLHEWMLPWWYANLRQHSRLPVVFTDLGLSRRARAWCEERGEVVRNVVPVEHAQLAKPLSIIRSPYAENLWTDPDCEILKPLEPVFEETRSEIGVVRDHPGAMDPIQTGVVVVRHGSAMALQWAELCRAWRRLDRAETPTVHYDQSLLSHLWRRQPEAFTLLRDECNWGRQREAPSDAVIVHWWGRDGKAEIRRRVAARPAGDPWKALGQGRLFPLRHRWAKVRWRLFDP
ncbi:MAG: hypothetical protein V1873_08840 [Verrucomicrobiota bacterium]